MSGQQYKDKCTKKKKIMSAIVVRIVTVRQDKNNIKVYTKLHAIN